MFWDRVPKPVEPQLLTPTESQSAVLAGHARASLVLCNGAADAASQAQGQSLPWEDSNSMQHVGIYVRPS